MPPEDRPLITVFPYYALFPHLTVAQDVGFALQLSRRARPKTPRQSQVWSNWSGWRGRCIATCDHHTFFQADPGAGIILLQEQFQTPYVCIENDLGFRRQARPLETDRAVQHFSTLARKLGVLLPVSYSEAAGHTFFNSLAMIDADGTIPGNYRKTDIPHATGYEKKYDLTPGDTNFKVFEARPETALSSAILGAVVLMFPTATGSEPRQSDFDCAHHWQRTMQSHAAANLVPVVASNRVGRDRRHKTCGLIVALETAA